MTGLYGTTAGPWAVEDDDGEFAHDYDVWISGGKAEGGGDMIVCACWNNDKRAIALVPDMLALVDMAQFANHDNIQALREVARAIVAKLENV